jgi:hypothetical protein
VTRATIIITALLTLPLCACADTGTIRDLGRPEFEEVVGKDTRFTRPDEKQVGSFDAYPATADPKLDHNWVFMFLPAGSPDTVAVQVRAAAKTTGNPLTDLAGAVYPLTQEQIPDYRRTGKVPGEPLANKVTSAPSDPEKGVYELIIELPRASIPQGTDKLAVPLLARFKDGWVSVHLSLTGVPAPVPEEPPPGEAPPTPPATPPAGDGSTPPPAPANGGTPPTPPAGGGSH